MGCDREERESEKVFDLVWNRMKNLAIKVWGGKYYLEDATEDIELTKRDLDNVIKLMEAEK